MRYDNANYSQYKQQELKSTQKPSSYSVNPEYFNTRLIKIKKNIDSLIKELLYPQEKQNSLQAKTQVISEDKGHPQLSKSYSSTYKNAYEQIPIQKIIGNHKLKIKSIYNEIYELEQITSKDEDKVDTHTFQLRSFIKDLNNQRNRIIKIVPSQILTQMEKQKKAPYTRLSIDQNQDPKNTQNSHHFQLVQKIIQEEISKRKSKADNQKYYEDQRIKCNLLKCQLI